MDTEQLDSLFSLIGNYGGLVTLAVLAVWLIIREIFSKKDDTSKIISEISCIKETVSLLYDAANLKCQRHCDTHSAIWLLKMYLAASSAELVHEVSSMIKRSRYSDFDTTKKIVSSLVSRVYDRHRAYISTIFYEEKQVSLILEDSFYDRTADLVTDWIISDAKHDHLTLMNNIDALNEETVNQSFVD